MIKQETASDFGIAVVVARCDDCDHPVAIATTEAIVIKRLQRRNPAWRPGLPIFCPDQAACAERTWQRYGRYLQRLIESIERAQLMSSYAVSASQAAALAAHDQLREGQAS